MSYNERTGLRRKILEATRTLLLSEGVHNLSMRKIAAQIGCKAPSIYYHFASKAMLIQALIEEGHQKLHSAMREVVTLYDDPIQRLEAYMRTYVAFGLENSEYYEIMFMSTRQASGLDTRESFHLARRSRQLATSALEEAHARGAIEESDFAQATGAIGIMLHGYVTLAIHHGSSPPFEPQKMLDVIIHRVFRAYGLTRAYAT